MNPRIILAVASFASSLKEMLGEMRDGKENGKDKDGKITTILSREDISKSMKKIEEGIEEIKKNTSEIIKNQKELLKLNGVKRKEDNRDVVGETTDKRTLDKIKSGVGTVILLAGAILAIGLAFKIIGTVDFVSVLALSLSITLIGHTLAKLADSKIPSYADSLRIGFSMLAFTTAVVASSWILTLIAPVSMSGLLTFGAILGAFSLLGLGIGSLVKSMGNIKPAHLLYLPLVLVGISGAVVASSHILQYTQLISPDILKNVLLTGLALGSLAVIMSLPILMLSKLGKNAIVGAMLSIIILPAMALGIVLSSYILNKYNVISPDILKNVLLTGLALGALAIVMTLPMFMLSKMGKSGIVGALLSIIVLPAMALGIVLSSMVLGHYKRTEPETLINILMTGATLGVLAIIMTLPMYALGKMGPNGIVGALLSIIVLPAMALGITLASMALQKFSTIPPNTLVNILFTGMVLGVLAIIMTIPLLVMGKFAGEMIAGAIVSIVVLPLIAIGIMLSSLILAYGDYSNPIPLGWAISFSLSMLILAIPVAILGALTLPVVAMGAAGLVLVAAAIMLSSWLFTIASPKGFEVIADAIAYFVKVVSPPIKEFIKDVVPIIAHGMGLLLTNVLPPLSAFIKGFIPLIEGFVLKMMDKVMPLISRIFDTIDVMIAHASEIIDSISGMIREITALLPAIGDVFTKVGNAIATPIKAIESLLTGVGGVIRGIINDTVDGIVRISEIDPIKLNNISKGLGVLGKAVNELSGGVISGGIRKLANIKMPIVGILESISKYGDGVEKVVNSIAKLPSIVDRINKMDVNKSSLSGLVENVSKLGRLKINLPNIDRLLNALDRIDRMKTVSGKLETVNKTLVEIDNIKKNVDPKNEKILQQLEIISQQLYIISENSGRISNKLSSLRDNDNNTSLSFL